MAEKTQEKVLDEAAELFAEILLASLREAGQIPINQDKNEIINHKNELSTPWNAEE